MIDLTKRKNISVLDKTDIFIAEEDFSWDGIKIFEDSLVIVDETYIYINETPLNFFNLMNNQYGYKLKSFQKGNSFVLNNSVNIKNDSNIVVSNRGMLRWNNNNFSNRCVPFKNELEKLPTFNYDGIEYSSWGYMINIDTKDIEGGFYMKDGKFFEMTGERIEDIEMK